MYADKETAAMRAAIGETNRRRAIQVAYNAEHGITPETVKKGISDMSDFLALESQVPRSNRRRASRDEEVRSPEELEKLMVELEEEMLAAAEELRFEYAAKLRDEIRDLRHELDLAAGREPHARRQQLGVRQRVLLRLVEAEARDLPVAHRPQVRGAGLDVEAARAPLEPRRAGQQDDAVAEVGQLLGGNVDLVEDLPHVPA